MGATYHNDFKERMRDIGSIKIVNSLPIRPGARELTVSTFKCAGSTPLMSYFLVLQKKKKKILLYFLAS